MSLTEGAAIARTGSTSASSLAYRAADLSPISLAQCRLLTDNPENDALTPLVAPSDNRL